MMSSMRMGLYGLVVSTLFLQPTRSEADPNNANTDWLKNARYGVFMHFLPGDPTGLALVEKFDVEALAQQLDAMGAKYFVITLGQNAGYFISPNSTYDKLTGYAPGERCSTRDLPLDLYRALKPKGIRLMLYLPCQTPNQDAQAQKAFGLRPGPADQPIDGAFADKWAEVIQEWSDRYGEQVAGWWFDGGYEHVRFNETIAQVYSKAVKHGNPHAIVTFNPGVKVMHYAEAEDYTAGELNEPFQTIPASRWLEGSQWHALTYLGSNWSQRDTRYPTEKWVKWVTEVVAHEGAVTLDMGPNWDPQAGPIGALAEAQVNQVQAIQTALTSTAPTTNRLKRAASAFGIHFDFHAGPDCREIGKSTTRRNDREDHHRGAARLHPDRLQRAPRSVELPHEGRQPGAGFCRRPAADLARSDGRTWRGALHALLGRLGLASDPPPPGMGGSQCGRQGQPECHVVFRVVCGQAVDSSIARIGRRVWRRWGLGRRRVLGIGAGLLSGGDRRLQDIHRYRRRSPQAGRSPLV